MRDGLTAEFLNGVRSPVVYLAFFVELEFDEGFLRFWTGIGQIDWNGAPWTGGGHLLKLSLAEETIGLEAKSTIIELTATPEFLAIALAHDEDWQGRPARVWCAQMKSWIDDRARVLLDNSGNAILDNSGEELNYRKGRPIVDENGDPVLDNFGNPLYDNNEAVIVSEIVANPVRWFKGTMDQLPIIDDPDRPILRLFVENDMITLTLNKERRLTHEDQQTDYPGDKFFEFVADLQDKEITLE